MNRVLVSLILVAASVAAASVSRGSGPLIGCNGRGVFVSAVYDDSSGTSEVSLILNDVVERTVALPYKVLSITWDDVGESVLVDCEDSVGERAVVYLCDKALNVLAEYDVGERRSMVTGDGRFYFAAPGSPVDKVELKGFPSGQEFDWDGVLGDNTRYFTYVGDGQWLVFRLSGDAREIALIDEVSGDPIWSTTEYAWQAPFFCTPGIYSADAQRLYFIDRNMAFEYGPSVIVLNREDGTVLRVLPTGKGAEGIVYTNDEMGEFYVLGSMGVVWVYEKEGLQMIDKGALQCPLSFAYSVAMEPRGSEVGLVGGFAPASPCRGPVRYGTLVIGYDDGLNMSFEDTYMCVGSDGAWVGSEDLNWGSGR